MGDVLRFCLSTHSAYSTYGSARRARSRACAGIAWGAWRCSCVLVVLAYLYLSAGVHLVSTYHQAHSARAKVAAMEREHIALQRQHEALVEPRRRRSAGAQAGPDEARRAPVHRQPPAERLGDPPAAPGRSSPAPGSLGRTRPFASLPAAPGRPAIGHAAQALRASPLTSRGCPSRTRSTSGSRASAACAPPRPSRRPCWSGSPKRWSPSCAGAWAGRFTAEELVELYGRGTSWCLQAAMNEAPGDPWAWDSGIVVDAAFGRYLREAADYAGGRRAVETT